MKILISACLLGQKCRYDGNANTHPAVCALADTHQLIAVCPEQLGGLPTPRPPAEIQADGHVRTQAGVDVTAAFALGAAQAVQLAQQHGCTHAILKAKSPSCGCGQIYDGTFSRTLIAGNGKAAAALLAIGVTVKNEGDVS